jgi:rhodanese-related sulfurtransferase
MPDIADIRYLDSEAVAALATARSEAFLIDLREPREYHAGHIPESLSLPAGDFADRYSREVEPEDSVVLICEKGMTAEAAAKYLKSQGFQDIAILRGGIAAYTGPLVKTR